MFTATEYHLGLLKAKLAKYRQQLLEPTGKSAGKVCDLHEITPPPPTHGHTHTPLAVLRDHWSAILWYVMVIYSCLLLFWFQGEGFDVMKSGDARVALIGFPSVGKVHRLIWYNNFRINVYEFMIHSQNWQICYI